MNEMEGVRARDDGLRCAVCHAGIGVDDVGRVCPGCGTRLHEDCAAQLGRCPTIGCALGAVGAVVAPATAAADAKNATEGAAPAFVLYSPNQVLIVSVLLSILGGALLVGINAWRLGRRALGVLVVGLGAAVLLTAIVVAELVGPHSSASVVNVLLALALRQVAVIAQGPAYRSHLAAGGRRGSTWGGLGLAVVALALLLVPVVRTYSALQETVPEVIRERAYGDARDRALAERLCSLRLALDPEDGWAYSMRGYIRGREGRHDEALRDHGNAVRIAPSDAWNLARRADTLLERRGHAREALADLERALEIEPGAAWFWSLRGCAHEDLGERSAARMDYEQALHADPGDSFARERLEALRR